MRSPLWRLLVDAAQAGAEVELFVSGQGPGPLVGKPVLPIASNHVVLESGTVVSLSHVSTARVRPEPGPEEPF